MRPGKLLATAAAGGATRRWRSTRRCRTHSSTGWEFLRLPANLNPSNRPVRTRMPGGVAGDAVAKPPRPYADCTSECRLMALLDNNEALDQLNRTRPEGVQRNLVSVELHARGLDNFSRDKPSLLTSVCLFDWETGRQICPPPQQSMAAAFAAIVPASNQRFSGEWWKETEDGAARRRAEQQRIADYYKRASQEQEDRENAEARERFAAHQPKN